MVSIISKIEEALEKVNVLVTIGSANDKDLLKPILKGYFNATIHFGIFFFFLLIIRSLMYKETYFLEYFMLSFR